MGVGEGAPNCRHDAIAISILRGRTASKKERLRCRMIMMFGLQSPEVPGDFSTSHIKRAVHRRSAELRTGFGGPYTRLARLLMVKNCIPNRERRTGLINKGRVHLQNPQVRGPTEFHKPSCINISSFTAATIFHPFVTISILLQANF